MSQQERLQAYLRECTASGLIVYSGDEHASAINSLCMDGKIGPALQFKAYDGNWRKANCLLSAEQFLKQIGQYNDSKNSEHVLAEYLTIDGLTRLPFVKES